MKTAMKDSSLEAYQHLKSSNQLSRQHKLVLDYVRKKGRCTRAMVSQDLFDNKTGTGSGRVNDLLNDFIHKPLLEELSLNPCPLTGRRVHWIYLNPANKEEIQ